MRWFWMLCIAMTVAAAVTACVVPGGPGPKSAGEPGPEPGKGQVILSLQPEDGRTILGSAWASAAADAYELVLSGPGGNRAVDLTFGPSQVLSVDPGVWKLVVLAGIKRTSGSTTALLVGSASAEDVVVTAGQRTSVTLVLKSVDVGLVPGGAAYWKGSLTWTAAGKTRNPRVGMLLAGASTTSRPRFKSAELWNGYRECSSVTGSPDDWTAEASGTVPDGAGGLTVGLVGAGLCFLDGGNSWVPTAGVTKYAWSWPNRADLADTHPLVPWTEAAVTAGPPPTGVEVSVTWE